MEKSHEEARRLFDDTALTYHRRSRADTQDFLAFLFSRRIAVVNRFLDQVPAGGRALDFGMGPAVFGRQCAKRGLAYTGIDISPAMVEEARALGLENAQFLVGDLTTLAGFRRQMSVVLAIGLVDYLERPREGLESLAACVAPGGRLIVSFRNRHSVPRALRDLTRSVVGRFKRRRSHRALLAGVHEHSFAPTTHLQPWLRECGFDRFEVDYINCSPVFFNFPLPRPLARAWFRWDSLIAGRRTRYLCSAGVLCAIRAEKSTS